MLACTGNKLPLTCVFAAIAIVFIHGLSLSVAPSEPEVREPEARAWAMEDYSKECSADCSSTTPGTCRYYIRNGDWGEERTCSYWCGSQGLTCHAMYDDSGNSCCSYKGNKLSCDYTGDSSDMDFICECWP